MIFKDLIPNHKFEINPICAESLGVRSFCIQIKTPDISIILDPGCALGLRGKYKIPHPLEFQNLYFFTKKILEVAKDCKYLFISHYHHDHYKPNLEDNFLIYSNKDIFKDLYESKKIFAKDIKKNINYNQKERGEAFKKDIGKINSDLRLIENNSENLQLQGIKSNRLIQDIIQLKDTMLVFPKEFLHGIHDKGQVFIQPVIIIFENIVFYYYPDIQGMPNNQDLHDLLDIKSLCNQIIIQNSRKNIHPEMHIIAFGGPMTYIFKNKQDNGEIIHRSLFNANNIIQTFDISIIDHHILREQDHITYWNKFKDVAKLHRKFISPFNPDILNFIEDGEPKKFTNMPLIPTMECYRDRLYELFPPSESFKEWADLAEKGKTMQIFKEI